MIEKPQTTVLHIISGDLWAGAEAMAYQLLSGLNQLEGIDLHLIILNEGRLERSCRRQGIKCYLLDEKKLSSVAIAGKTIRISRKIKPNIIHAHRYKENILATIIAGFCRNSRLVTTQHGRTEGINASLRKSIIDKLSLTCLKWFFKGVVAVSNDTADYIIQTIRVNPKRLTIITNGIGLPSASRSSNYNKNGRPFIIGSAGRLFPVKRFMTFIEIARVVCSDNSQARFVIAGEGPERENLLNLIAKYGLEEEVRLLGHVDDMQTFYAGLDLYINTSMHEGTPMSILEAMANKLPIIAFGVAGLNEIITDGADGFTIPMDDNALFAATIDELIDHPEIIRAFGEAALIKIVNCFSSKKMVEKYLTLYHRLL